MAGKQVELYFSLDTNHVSLSDSQQEIEATLTEMESCMKLLSPEFGLSDVLPGVNSTPPNSIPANHRPSDDEQPCCSRDLRDDRREGAKQEGEGSREEKTSCGTERREDERRKEMLEVRGGKRNDREEGKGKGKMERRFEDDREQGERSKDGEENEEEIDKGEEKREQEEHEEGSSEEEEEEKECFDDFFIRNSGLISHSYNLDLNLSPGEWIIYTHTVTDPVSDISCSVFDEGLLSIGLHQVHNNDHVDAMDPLH